MGLILIPSEVMQRTENLSEIVPRIVEGYQNVLQTIRDFSSESELDTEAWNTLKIRVLDYHQNIAKGILAAGDDMISDADTLQQSVGTEELYEDTLKDIIEKLEKEKEEYENKIQNLEMLCNGFWGGLLGGVDSMFALKARSSTKLSMSLRRSPSLSRLPMMKPATSRSCLERLR